MFYNHNFLIDKAIKIVFDNISTYNIEQNKPDITKNEKSGLLVKLKDLKNLNRMSKDDEIIPKFSFNDRKSEFKTILNKLLDVKNIDPNSHNENYTLLSYACEINDIDIVKKLLKKDNIDVNAYAYSSGQTPLMISILNRNTEIAEILINDKRTNVNIKNYQNETALILAVDKAMNNIVELIIKNERFDPDESCINYAFLISPSSISKHLISVKSLDVNYNYIKNNHSLNGIKVVSKQGSFGLLASNNDNRGYALRLGGGNNDNQGPLGRLGGGNNGNQG